MVVLHGGKTPYILRQEGEHHVVVGWTYVQDLISGEVGEMVQTRELKEEAFHLELEFARL